MGAGAGINTYVRNSVQGQARRAGELRADGLPILVDCGAADEFLLHDGAVHLHEVVTELGIAHSFRLVEGAGHVGPEAASRTKDAIRFIGAAVTSRGPRPTVGSSNR
ncbi:hypothetical protein UA75_28390 [Actinoalloteichus sp. GBA129-24]|uniref:Uncharacterized protein n=1 Tax=Actinoalloteichus fjordicus TaxID=1612552 RepID=A0AAC9PV36_9PSEU|nr:hypothetical protein UA74_27850 [Actinoalloteichus fjordicus]APU23649.1 hypothetical protein UA75_28390 [Actinoalloteichus sp. GBA129-24]